MPPEASEPSGQLPAAIAESVLPPSERNGLHQTSLEPLSVVTDTSEVRQLAQVQMNFIVNGLCQMTRLLVIALALSDFEPWPRQSCVTFWVADKHRSGIAIGLATMK